MAPLSPPFRFAAIEAGLYRGSFPKPHNFPFLAGLQLGAWLALVPVDQDCKAVQQFCEQHGIHWHRLGCAKPKDDVTMTRAVMWQALQWLIDSVSRLQSLGRAVYVHCMDGTQTTGLVVMCLRKLQLWPISAAVAEFSRFTRDHTIMDDELEFVHKFGGSGIATPLPCQFTVLVRVQQDEQGQWTHSVHAQTPLTATEPQLLRPPMTSLSHQVVPMVSPLPSSSSSSTSASSAKEQQAGSCLVLLDEGPAPPSWLWRNVEGASVPRSFFKHIHLTANVTDTTMTWLLTVAHPTCRVRLAESLVLQALQQLLAPGLALRTVLLHHQPQLPVPVLCSSRPSTAAYTVLKSTTVTCLSPASTFSALSSRPSSAASVPLPIAFLLPVQSDEMALSEWCQDPAAIYAANATSAPAMSSVTGSAARQSTTGTAPPTSGVAVDPDTLAETYRRLSQALLGPPGNGSGSGGAFPGAGGTGRLERESDEWSLTVKALALD